MGRKQTKKNVTIRRLPTRLNNDNQAIFLKKENESSGWGAGSGQCQQDEVRYVIQTSQKKTRLFLPKNERKIGNGMGVQIDCSCDSTSQPRVESLLNSISLTSLFIGRKQTMTTSAAAGLYNNGRGGEEGGSSNASMTLCA